MPLRTLKLSDNADQSFIHRVGDDDLKISVKWNGSNSFWTIDFHNNATGQALLLGAAIMSGVNITVILPDYKIECLFLAKNNVIADPTRDNLKDGFLYIGRVL